MNVISTVSAATMPNAVHRPKFLIVGSPNAASDAEAERRDRPRRQHDDADLDRRLDDRDAVVLRRRAARAGRRARARVLLVVALEDLHRVAGADRQQQDRRHDVPGIHRRADEAHQAQRPDDAHDRRDQRDDHPLQRAERAVVQVADHRQRQHEQQRRPGACRPSASAGWSARPAGRISRPGSRSGATIASRRGAELGRAARLHEVVEVDQHRGRRGRRR